MIRSYTPNEPPLSLKADLAGEFPLYLYLSDDKQLLLYSKNSLDLFNDSRVQKPLRVSNKGVSFLLQSGVVPPPETPYENLFILGIGDVAKIQTVNGKIELDFASKFPFFNSQRMPAAEDAPDEDLILRMLAEATISRIDPGRPSFLFHSAGKDSNSIVLALAEAGWQDKVTLVSHRSKGDKDESEISAKIAKQLGFKHKILQESDHLDEIHKKSIEAYFANAPFPCTDNVSLAYPPYALQLPELKGANIIDGMGNDVFIGHIPGSQEYKKQKMAKYLKWVRPFLHKMPSTSLLYAAGKSRPEHTGLGGLSFSDTRFIYPEGVDANKYWGLMNDNLEYLDLRASVRGKIIDQEVFLRKVRNFADTFNGNLVLPWANENIAEYLGKMPEVHLFDRSLLKNKLILRKILKKRMGLDSDKIGKMIFSYDKESVIFQNWGWVSSHIINCTLWDPHGIQRLTASLKGTAQGSGRKAGVAVSLLNRLFLISIWYNTNKYMTAGADLGK